MHSLLGQQMSTVMIPTQTDSAGLFKEALAGGVGLPRCLNSKEAGSTPQLDRCCREGNGNPLQYSCLGNGMDGGAWQTPYSQWGGRRVGRD